MRKLNSFLVCILFGLYLSANADFNPSKVWPPYIMGCHDSDSLISYLKSTNEIERDAACIRIGELAEKKLMGNLLKAFENEKVRTGIDLPYGVKYYSLISMGEIGDSSAEIQIMDIVRNHLLYSARPAIYSTSDTILVLEGAFEALSKIKTNSARVFLDSLYEKSNLYWFIRSMANLNSMRIKLADNIYSTKVDTAQFLFAHLDNLGGPHRQFDEKGRINDDFIVTDNIESLIYEYGSWIMPYLDKFLNSLSQDDSRLSSLRELKKMMEVNPPESHQ